MSALNEVFRFLLALIDMLATWLSDPGGIGFYVLIGLGFFVAGAVIGLVYRLIRG